MKDLMNQEPIDKIRVTEICKAAVPSTALKSLMDSISFFQ